MQITIPKLPDDLSDVVKLREFLSAIQKLLEQKQADDNKIVADIPKDTKALFNVTGSAPMYACRAWVNFNGTGTVAIRGSGNVSSITDNGVGQYNVNLTTAIQDVNYSISVSANRWCGAGVCAIDSVSSFHFRSTDGLGVCVDSADCYAQVFV